MGVGPLAPILQRAVFFDRDGVLNEPVIRNGKPYPPRDSGELVLVPGAQAAVRRLANVVPLLFVVTNQPDVARRTQSRENVESINRKIAEALPITRFYTCYHDDADSCACRKPMPGSLFEAARAYRIELRSSFMIGDRWRDIDAGSRAGCTTVFIDRSYDERSPEYTPDIVVHSLDEGIERILERISHPSPPMGATHS